MRRKPYRTSTQALRSNQLRLYFSSFAYVLIETLRALGLGGTELAQAQCDTIRLKLLKYFTPRPRRAYSYDEIIKCDKASRDIFWLKDESLSESENFPPLDVIAQEIAEDVEAALGQIQEILSDLGPRQRRRTV